MANKIKINIQLIYDDDDITIQFNYNIKLIKLINKNFINLYKEYSKYNYTFDLSYKSNDYLYLSISIYDLIIHEQKYIQNLNENILFNKKHDIIYYL
jgi:hypothetical protein